MIPIEKIKRRITSSFGHQKEPVVLDDTLYRLRIGPLQLLQNTSALFLRFIIPNGIASREICDGWIFRPQGIFVACLNVDKKV